MNRIISVILLFSLMFACSSGCSTPSDDIGKIDLSGENKDNTIELDEMFDIIRTDVALNNKIFFYTGGEDLYYELKNSGQYENSRWQSSAFHVTIECNFEDAVDEDWYKQCSKTDTKILNEAFYNHLASTLLKGEFVNVAFIPGARLRYSSAIDLYSDYLAIKSLTDLDYVTIIQIGYHYGLPYDYLKE